MEIDIDIDDLKEIEDNYEGIVDFVSSEIDWCVKSCRVTQVINGNTTTEV